MKRRVLAFLILIPFLGPSEARTDILILKDGSVVECKIKDLKYPDPNVTSKFVITAEIDEKGTTKQYFSQELKREAGAYAIYKGKTVWERRAEYQKEYDRRAESVKDAWDAHFSLGKWCKSHLLAEKGEQHYRTAYKLRSEKSPDTLDDHLRLARWCQKEMGLEDDADKEFRKALALKRSALKEDSAAEHAALGKWCESVDLTDDAVKEYEVALDKDPKNSTASLALKHIRDSVEFRTRQFAIELSKDRRAWKMTVAVQEPASKEFLETWKKKIEDLSAYIFTITEGQFYIAEVEIEDGVQEGTIIIEKGKLDWRGMQNKEGQGVLGFCRSGGGGYEVHVPGLAAISVLCHEVFHGAFGLPDEYLMQPMCDCLMKSAPNPQKLCDPGSHVKGNVQGDCWARVTARYKSAKHPNPAWKAMEKKPAGPGPAASAKPMARDYAEGGRVYGELEWSGLKLPAPPPTKVTVIDN